MAIHTPFLTREHSRGGFELQKEPASVYPAVLRELRDFYPPGATVLVIS